MARKMKYIAIVLVTITIIFIILYRLFSIGVLLSLSITFGVTSYHFCIRLLVGYLFNIIMKNHADYNKPWYQVKEKEQRFYEEVRVKKWKQKMPTYDIDIFDPQKHSWDEIAQAMCQSELVHEINIIVSFLPIVSHIWFGALPVFIITSILAGCFDMLFVMIQRYNRPRIINLLNRSL